MVRYTVRSVPIVNIVNDLKDGKLILSPYFQRNLVWREIHRREFLDTILEGYPFPQVFFAKGDIDVETLRSQQCVVDGQQRLSTILSFVDNEIDVRGRHFKDLTVEEKEAFLTYEVPVIDFDARHDDDRVREVFKRVNRTFYALSLIEKLSSEYGASEFMLLAQYMCGDMKVNFVDEDIEQPDLRVNPNVSVNFIEWASIDREEFFLTLIGDSSTFTSYELSRKVALMFTLNVMSSIVDGYYDRNDRVRQNLEKYKDGLDIRDGLFFALNKSALNVLDNDIGAFWYRKANLFTLLVELARAKLEGLELSPTWVADVVAFGNEPPEAYVLAAREGVNNRKERLIRANEVRRLVTGEALLA
jgi:hypothetical protein